MAKELFESEMKEMKKLKQQFAKELKILIDTEIQREQKRRVRLAKLERYNKKME